MTYRLITSPFGRYVEDDRIVKSFFTAIEDGVGSYTAWKCAHEHYLLRAQFPTITGLPRSVYIKGDYRYQRHDRVSNVTGATKGYYVQVYSNEKEIGYWIGRMQEDILESSERINQAYKTVKAT